MTEKKECFVISPIGPEGSETRERANKLLNHVIKNAVSERGYETIRADAIDEPGQITTQVIQHTVNSDLVIADLTNQNPNVFYELAIRHAAREPIIQIIEKGDGIPFDVHNQRTIKIDIEDLNSVENAKDDIRQQIDTIESGEVEVDSPITTAMNLQFWEESGDPQQQELADVIEMMTEMKSTINIMKSDMEDIALESEFKRSDLENIVEIYDKSDTMKRALSDVKELVEPVEFGTKDENHDFADAIDYLDRSLREIRRESDKFLEKYY